MKTKIFLAISVSFFLISSVFSQGEGKHKRNMSKKDIQAAKVGFITNYLQLTVEEAQIFWPVYNEFEKKQSDIQEKRKATMDEFRDKGDALSNKQLEEIADKLANAQGEQEKLFQEYHVKFKKVLPIKKVILFYQAEVQFKSKLLKQISKGKREQQE